MKCTIAIEKIKVFLVLYGNSDNFAMWTSNTNGQGATQCVMQADGNLVIYNQGGEPLWASG